MSQLLRVDTAGMHAMATRWGASVGALNETVAPAGLGLSCQPSAVAVTAGHADIAVFTAALVTRVGTRAIHVAEVVLVVAPEARRRGIGRALARRLLVEAVEQGFKKVTVMLPVVREVQRARPVGGPRARRSAGSAGGPKSASTGIGCGQS